MTGDRQESYSLNYIIFILKNFSDNVYKELKLTLKEPLVKNMGAKKE